MCRSMLRRTVLESSTINNLPLVPNTVLAPIRQHDVELAELAPLLLPQRDLPPQLGQRVAYGAQADAAPGVFGRLAGGGEAGMEDHLVERFRFPPVLLAVDQRVEDRGRALGQLLHPLDHLLVVNAPAVVPEQELEVAVALPGRHLDMPLLRLARHPPFDRGLDAVDDRVAGQLGHDVAQRALVLERDREVAGSAE